MTPIGIDTFSSSMGQASRYNRWILASVQPYLGPRVLEVGLGHGGVAALLPQGTEYVGVDLDPRVIQKARELLPRAQFIEGDITSAATLERLGERSHDCVLCLNVLEHVEDDGAAVRHLLRLVRPGGRLVLFVPAFQALFNDLDRLAGHVRRYGKAQLTALVTGAGGRVVRARYFNPVGAIGWWLNRWLRHGSLESGRVAGQVQFFDRYVLPVSRCLDLGTRGFFGQSILCIAEPAPSA